MFQRSEIVSLNICAHREVIVWRPTHNIKRGHTLEEECGIQFHQPTSSSYIHQYVLGGHSHLPPSDRCIATTNLVHNFSQNRSVENSYFQTVVVTQICLLILLRLLLLALYLMMSLSSVNLEKEKWEKGLAESLLLSVKSGKYEATKEVNQ